MKGHLLDRVEWAAVVTLTSACVWLNIVAARSAGALWRDEANTVGVSTLPTIRDVWTNLQYDSFPLLWMVLVRVIAHVFGEMNDPAFRVTGLIIGVSLIAALWINARAFGYFYPFVSLAFLGLNPSIVRWATSFRGTGLGVALGLVTGACIWRFLQKPTRGRFIIATIFGVASVQMLYYNAFVLLGFCAAGIIVAAINHRSKIAWSVFGIGVIAAISLVPYFQVFRQATTWNSLVRIPSYNFAWFAFKLRETLSPTGLFLPLSWTGLFVLAIFASVRSVARGSKTEELRRSRDLAVFLLVALSVGCVSTYAFLKILSYVTQPWYYLTLLMIVATCAEISWFRLIVSQTSRVIRLAIVSVVAIVAFLKSYHVAQMPLTNVDRVAAELESQATRGDLIVVDEWPIGVSFNRYFHGSASWTTVPSIGFYRFHRYDLVRRAMEGANQPAVVSSVTSRIEETLKTGGSVFVLENFPRAIKYPPLTLGPARIPKDGWRLPQYQMQWSGLLEQFLQQHASRMTSPAAPDLNVSHFENIQVVKAEGWKP